MDVCESEKASEKQSTAEGTRQPLVSADNKNGTTRRSQTREVSSRYRSPTPSAASGPKRSPSPIVSTKLSTSTASVPKRAISAERKRPTTPSSPRSRSPSTLVRDTAADMLLASRKTTSNKMPDSLWPSTMRSLGSSFQSDSGTLLVSKREKAVLLMPSVCTLRPSSNVAHQGESSPSGKSTPEKKRSLPKGKNSPDQLENSKPWDSLNAHQLDQHRWPSRTSGKTFTALNRSDIIDKRDKTTNLANAGLIKPSLRRLSLDGTIKSDITDKMDNSSVLSHSESVKPSLDGASKGDITGKMDNASHSGMVKPSSPRRLSLGGSVKSDITHKMDKTLVSSNFGTVKPSLRRLSLDGAIKSDITDKMDKTDSGTGKPSPRRLSSDRVIKRDATDLTDKTLSLSHSETVKPSTRRLSLDGAAKSNAANKMDKPVVLSQTGLIRPSSPRRLSLDGTIKSNAANKMEKPLALLSQSGTVKPSSPKRLSLDGTIRSDAANKMEKPSPLSHSGTVKPSSPKRLSPDGAIQIDAANKIDKPTVKPSSPRRLSLDGTIKSDATDVMDKTSFLSDSEMVKPSPRSLSLDGTIKSDTTNKMDKTSLLSFSRSGGKSPRRRLSLDFPSKPIQKSATDLLIQISRDDNVKEMLHGRSVDDGLPRIQRPNSSSSSDRPSSSHAAARTQSLLIPGLRLPSVSVSRGMNPSRAQATNLSSRGNSPSRVRPSSPRQPQNSTSVLSFIPDVKKGNMAANVEDVHQLRLLYNRHLQWRFANARAGSALHSQKVKAENLLYSMWRIIADIWALMREKRSSFQQLGLKLKLYAALHSEVTCLDEWASVERDHINTLTRLTQALQASTILIPLARGARGDLNSIKGALYSGAHVMQSLGSSLSSVFPKVEEMNRLVAELADLAACERAMLNETESLLASTNSYQVEECYLRTLTLQAKQGY